MEIERAVRNVSLYAEALANSPEYELASVINALNGGFIAPTSGGDPVLNPLVLPTGRNMFAINAYGHENEASNGVNVGRL